MAVLAPSGYKPVISMVVLGISALIIGSLVDPIAGLMPLFGMLCLMLAVFFAYFWRDPDRPIPRQDGVLVSPADGHAMFLVRERAIGRRPSTQERETGTIEHDELTGDWYPEPLAQPLSFETEQRFEAVPLGEECSTDVWRIAIFMSPLDVHVNRAPESGVIERLEHRTGKGLHRGPFMAAYKKESEFNERVRSVYLLDNGERIEMTQISGALARTIIPYLLDGTTVKRGQRIGMIQLGSRVDIRVPAERYTSTIITAADNHAEHPKGMMVQAGATILFEPLKEGSE